MSSTVKKGREGEKIAADYLTKLGYTIVDYNFVYSHCEIDIIAYDGEVLVFIEVKTRNTGEFGTGEESITEKKKSQLKRAAIGYLIKNDISDTECRFDAVVVENPYSPSEKINHFINIIEY